MSKVVDWKPLWKSKTLSRRSLVHRILQKVGYTKEVSKTEGYLPTLALVEIDRYLELLPPVEVLHAMIERGLCKAIIEDDKITLEHSTS